VDGKLTATVTEFTENILGQYRPPWLSIYLLQKMAFSVLSDRKGAKWYDEKARADNAREYHVDKRHMSAGRINW
jgi:hypothetical protein